MSLNCFRNDLQSLEKLIKKLWSENYNLRQNNRVEEKIHSYRKIENKCEEISYNLSLAHWLSNFIRKNLDKSPAMRKHCRLLQLFSQSLPLETNSILQTQSGIYPEANEIFLILENSSLIYSLKDMLKDLNIDELFQELDRIKPFLSPRLCCYHENNYNILLIYSIIIETLNVIIYKISQKKVQNATFAEFQENLEKYIRKITKIDYLLILFELLFDLMRLKLKHLKIFAKTQCKFSSTFLRKSRENYVINKGLGSCILGIIEQNLKMAENIEISSFSKIRLDNLMRKTKEFRLKSSIVYNSKKIITSDWKSIQSFKRINLKGQEDFDNEAFALRCDLVFKNKKVYASYYMNYMEFDAEYLLKLALANKLFKESQLLIEVFQLNSNFSDNKSLVSIFALINEKANEILEKSLENNRNSLEIIETPLNSSQRIEESDNMSETPTISEIISIIRRNYFPENLIESETFKFLADFTFTSDVSLVYVPFLIRETQKYLQKCDFFDLSLFLDYLNRINLLVEHNLNSQQVPNSYSISSLMSDTKNIENLAVEPSLLLEHLSQKTSEKQMLVNLSEKLRSQSEFSFSLTHSDLYKLIQNTIEILSKKTEENSYSSTNFVKLFLKYMMDLGSIMKQALSKNMPEGQRSQVLVEFNYGLLLLIDPKTIIAIMIFLLKCEKESLEIAQLMRVNILDVILNQNNTETLRRWSLLPLFNVKKQEDLRVKNRIVGFIFEMEREFPQYQFMFDEKKCVELPIFSILALMTQNLTPISKSKEVIN